MRTVFASFSAVLLAAFALSAQATPSEQQQIEIDHCTIMSKAVLEFAKARDQGLAKMDAYNSVTHGQEYKPGSMVDQTLQWAYDHADENAETASAHFYGHCSLDALEALTPQTEEQAKAHAIGCQQQNVARPDETRICMDQKISALIAAANTPPLAPTPSTAIAPAQAQSQVQALASTALPKSVAPPVQAPAGQPAPTQVVAPQPEVAETQAPAPTQTPAVTESPVAMPIPAPVHVKPATPAAAPAPTLAQTTVPSSAPAPVAPPQPAPITVPAAQPAPASAPVTVAETSVPVAAAPTPVQAPVAPAPAPVVAPAPAVVKAAAPTNTPEPAKLAAAAPASTAAQPKLAVLSPPSLASVGKLTLGMSMSDAEHSFHSYGEEDRDEYGAETQTFLISDGHGYVVLLTEKGKPDTLYGIEYHGGADADTAPAIMGVRLGQSALSVLTHVGEPSRRERLPNSEFTRWYYDGRNYSFDISSGGDLVAIRLYGYEGLQPKDDDDTPVPVPVTP